MNIEKHITENVGWLRRKARKYYTNQWDADDLASETIYKLLRSATHYDPRKPFRPWADQIMRNIYITQYNRHKCVLFTDGEDYEPPMSPDETDQRVMLKDLLSIICSCARKSITIECVVLYAKGYTYEEIAERLEVPVGTVRSRMNTARELIRNALKE